MSIFQWKYSRRQQVILLVVCVAHFANSVCVSLQAPFYPQEAEKKGATSSEYGLVFGIFELVVFIVSPFYGKYIHSIGPKLMFNCGILTVSVSAVCFGQLDRIEGHYQFIILSFVIRIIEAMGNAAFLTASYSIISREFPEGVGTAFATVESSFGFGLIVGPSVGGLIFQMGGFEWPFLVLGSSLFVTGLLTVFLLPQDDNSNDGTGSQNGQMLTILRIPGVMIAVASIIATSMSIGFIQASLEPHLRPFNLTPVALGMMFIINGGTYALTTTFWGSLCDNFVHPKVVILAGCGLVILGFSLIGPAAFVPLDTTLGVTIAGLIFHGLGVSAQLVSTFTDARGAAAAYGFPNTMELYGLISSLWTSTFALGAFIGPSVAGFLLHYVGFRNASMFIIILHLFVGIVTLFYILSCLTPTKTMYTQINETEELQVSMNSAALRLLPSVRSNSAPPDRLSASLAHNSYSSAFSLMASYSGKHRFEANYLGGSQRVF